MNLTPTPLHSIDKGKVKLNARHLLERARMKLDRLNQLQQQASDLKQLAEDAFNKQFPGKPLVASSTWSREQRMPGRASEVRGLDVLALEMPSGSEVFMDSGYTDYLAEDAAEEADQVRFSVCRKKNSKRFDEPAERVYKTLMRKKIETVFSEITRMFPKRIHAVTLKGFLMKVSFFIIAFTLDRAFI
jgi:hypothetical protein